MVATYQVIQPRVAFHLIAEKPNNQQSDYCLDLSNVAKDVPGVSNQHLEILKLKRLNSLPNRLTNKPLLNKNAGDEKEMEKKPAKRSREDDEVKEEQRAKIPRKNDVVGKVENQYLEETTIFDRMDPEVYDFVTKIINERDQLAKHNEVLVNKVTRFQQIFRNKELREKCIKAIGAEN